MPLVIISFISGVGILSPLFTIYDLYILEGFEVPFMLLDWQDNFENTQWLGFFTPVYR